jgi:hypothetical protein
MTALLEIVNKRNLKPFFWFALPVVIGLVVLYALLSDTFPSISGKTGNGDSRGSSMSADGRLISFISNDSHNPGGSNSRQNVYIYNNETGNTILASTNSDGEPADGNSGNSGLDFPKISADGEVLIFTSMSTNLVPGVKGGLFKKNLNSGEIKIVAAVDDSGEPLNQLVIQDSVSEDGHFVVFTSSKGVFVYDDQSETTIRADIDTNGNELINTRPGSGNGPPSISSNGRFVSFSLDTSLAEKKNGRESKSDIYIKDRQTGQITMVSADEKDHAFDSDSINASISADGNLLVFESGGTVQLKDLKSGNVRRLTEGTNPLISGNGRYVVYQKNNTVSNQMSCENNIHCPNAFLLDLQTGGRKREVIPSDWDTWSRLDSLAVSDDGVIGFTASASFNGINPEKCEVNRNAESGGPTERNCSNVFRKDPSSGQLTRVSGIGSSTVELVEEEHPPEYYSTAVQNELRNAAAAEERYHNTHNAYTLKLEDLKDQGFAPSNEIVLNIDVTSSRDFCIMAYWDSEQERSIIWSFSKSMGTPIMGTCP